MTKLDVMNDMISDSTAKVEELRNQLAMEEKYLEDLKVRKQAVAATKPAAQAVTIINGSHTSPTFFGATMPDMVRATMAKGSGTMRAVEIRDTLVRQGVTGKNQKGLLKSVLSALDRREDLFEKVGRGTYKLKT